MIIRQVNWGWGGRGSKKEKLAVVVVVCMVVKQEINYLKQKNDNGG